MNQIYNFENYRSKLLQYAKNLTKSKGIKVVYHIEDAEDLVSECYIQFNNWLNKGNLCENELHIFNTLKQILFKLYCGSKTDARLINRLYYNTIRVKNFHDVIHPLVDQEHEWQIKDYINNMFNKIQYKEGKIVSKTTYKGGNSYKPKFSIIKYKKIVNMLNEGYTVKQISKKEVFLQVKLLMILKLLEKKLKNGK